MNVRHRIVLIGLGVLVSTGATALDVNVVGLFPNKAVLQIESGALRTLSVGEKTRDGIILLSVERDGATFDIQGRRVGLALSTARTSASPTAAVNHAMVSSDGLGNLVADGQVNGTPIRFAVDTGATFIAFSVLEANRLGLDYRKGQKTMMQTANGDVLGYRLKLDTVRVGDIAEHNVDAVVIEGKSLSNALLGMSFLNRVDIRREGAKLTLTKRD